MLMQQHIGPLGGVEADSIYFLRFFSDQLHDHRRVEMDNKSLELQSVEVQARAAAAVATKDHNLAMVSLCRQLFQLGRPLTPSNTSANTKMEEKKQQRHREGLAETSSSKVGVPGLRSERRASPERLQQIARFHKQQMEEKQVKWGNR